MIASTNLYMPVCLPVWALDQAVCEMNSRTVNITERLGPHFDDVNILCMYRYWYVYMMLSEVYTI